MRPRISVSSAACTWRSDSESSADVASSRIRIGAFLRIARAIAIALPLAAGQPDAVLADHRVEAVGHRADEVERVRGGGGTLDFVSRGAPAIAPYAMLAATVSLNSSTSCDTIAICARRLASVSVVTSWPSMNRRPGGRLVEARDQVDERRLAAARRADQRDRLAGRDRERDVGQRLAFVAGVAQRHALEAQLAAARPSDHGAVVRLLFVVEEAEDALGGGEAALDRRVDAGQRLQPLEQREQRHRRTT